MGICKEQYFFQWMLMSSAKEPIQMQSHTPNPKERSIMQFADGGPLHVWFKCSLFVYLS